MPESAKFATEPNVRQAVKDKLGDRAKNYVIDIQLGDFDTKIKKITNDSAEAIV
ncbi:hypothetical protein ACEC18_004479 [Vibrio parahaemolyticus]